MYRDFKTHVEVWIRTSVLSPYPRTIYTPSIMKRLCKEIFRLQPEENRHIYGWSSLPKISPPRRNVNNHLAQCRQRQTLKKMEDIERVCVSKGWAGKGEARSVRRVCHFLRPLNQSQTASCIGPSCCRKAPLERWQICRRRDRHTGTTHLRARFRRHDQSMESRGFCQSRIM